VVGVRARTPPLLYAVYYKAKSEYGLRVKIWGGANRIPRIPCKGVGVKRDFSWKEVRDKREADWLCHLWGGGRGEIHKEEKRGKGCKPSY
jgi:hypothetical protein